MLVLSTDLLPAEPSQCGGENGRAKRSLETDVGLHNMI